MERVVFVEVLGRHGDVVQRVRLTQLPATIGRAWTNDVILADPHVDPQHARLTVDEQGQLVVEDLGSVNGLFADGARDRVGSLALRDLATVRLGRTVLRVVPAEQPVPAALPVVEPDGRLALLLASPRDMTTVALLGVLLSGLSLWLGEFHGQTGRELAGDLVGLVAVILLYAGLWALAGRLIVQRARFWAHATLSWLFLLIVGVWGVVEAYLNFLFPGQRIVAATGWLLGMVLVVLLIAEQAALASAASRMRRMAFGAGLAGGMALLAWLGEKASHDSYSTVVFNAEIKPLPAALVPASSLDHFIDVTTQLKGQVDKLEDKKK